MSITYNNTTQLFDNLSADTLILTPNRRLSRFLQYEYGVYQSNRNRRAWQTLSCLSIQGWVQREWDLLQIAGCSGTDRAVVTAIQERIIWQQIIENHSGDYRLLNIPQTADLAREAWDNATLWGVDPTHLSGGQEDTRLFQMWSMHYRQFCLTRQILGQASQQQLFCRAVIDGQVALPASIWLIGFDTLAPVFQQVFDYAAKQHTSVAHVNLSQTAQVCRVSCANTHEEITAAAQWAATILAKDPLASIGIVGVNVAKYRAQIEQIFTQVFEPQYILPDHPRHAPGFNISAAQPLVDTAPVASALLALQLNRQQMAIEDVSRLLRSVFIGSAEEFNERALLDLDLRTEDVFVRVSRLRAIASEPLPTTKALRCEDLYQRLRLCHDIQRKYQATQLPSKWAQQFQQQLILLGWPGPRPLDTLEFQQVKIWRETLEQMASLDVIAGKVDFERAYRYLQYLCSGPFHAQTQHSPVQVLGIFEAAGMQFDYLWLMNFDNHQWPPAPKPNPLLPIKLQVQRGMPNASTHREFQLSAALTERFTSSAKSVVISYAALVNDAEHQVSSLVKHYPEVSLTELGIDWQRDYLTSLWGEDIDAFVDSTGPKMSEIVPIKGGAQVIQDQAACPFRAFARHRLHTNQLIKPRPGLTAMDRGNVIHRALEVVWRRLRTQKKLLSLTQSELESLTSSSVDLALTSLTNIKQVGERLQKLEHRRMCRLILEWLELEKQRAPFSVSFSEVTRQIRLAKLPLKVRYDRIDKLEDGRLLVIDYKTGVQDIRSWSGERPDEPQVPLYAIAQHKHVVGAAFGQLHVSEVAFKGIAEIEFLAPGLKQPEMLGKIDLPSDWTDILQYWRQVMEKLAREFIAGTAEVKPKHARATCQFCELQSVCRVKEYIAVEDDESVDGDD